ncbi:hypothetical protein POL68_05345 [Stigmatella sp. ncwal1]|uniref:Uncharacterized protein n=1 Tax=Stigmatella ashevillensis TaxID=2995309 RepID=A0ABT5D2K0_9BACT|nr:hypothetical protein [Stigmatella ashevillena]MDC0707888.1 hypothetical protein [Stigmatella ashevillena]
MPHLRTWSCLAIAISALLLPGAARAQWEPESPPAPTDYGVPSEAAPAEQAAPAEDPAYLPPPPTEAQDAPLTPPPPDSSSLRTVPQPPLTENGAAPAALRPPPPPESRGPLLDGRPRQGPFLSGPGSLTFLMHHALLGAAGGLFTQGFANDFSFDRGSREAMLAGTLIGAGLGFGAAAWWQFNNWVDRPMAYFGIPHSLVGGMFLGGFMHLLSDDRDVLAWSSFVGAELGAWLTATVGGGQMPLNHGLMVTSGAGWGLAYSALLLAIVHFSGTDVRGKTWTNTLLIAPGIGAGALALATMQYNPTAGQILRADLFGGGVGAVVLLVSGLVLGGFDQPTPYVLSFLGSVGAITTVSLLWEESVDRTAITSSSRKKPYKNVWW